MKKLALIITLMFTFTQAFAVGYGETQTEDQKLDLVFAKAVKAKNERQFKRSKKKVVRQLKREIKKVEKLDFNQQTEHALKGLKKLNKKNVRIAKRAKRNKRVKRKITLLAQKRNAAAEEADVDDTLNAILSGELHAQMEKNLLDEITEKGSYVEVLKERLAQIIAQSYNKVKKTKAELIGKSYNGDDLGDLLAAIFWAVVLIGILIGGVIVGSIVLFALGYVAAGAAVLGGGTLLLIILAA